MNTRIKTSVSLQKPIWEFLKKFENKSLVINQAVELYMDKQKFMQKADEAYWKKVENSLQQNTGEYFSINQNGENIDENLLNEKLWN